MLCSTNEHKARELELLLQGWRIAPLQDTSYPPEEGETYYDNARTKALHGRALVPAGVWVIGEDSGIEVDGLGGRPGIHSARFGGDDPVGSMLAALESIEGEGRRARYVCELVVFSPEPRELRGTGTLEGRITDVPAGSEGFGYDPIFIPRGEERTVAQLGDEWKARNSHRARAARALLGALESADGAR